MAKRLRLDKWLSHSGQGSRKEVRDLCRQGRVLVNGEICRDGAQLVETGVDRVQVDRQPVCYEEFYYIMLYKPRGVISATTDAACRTVLDFLPPSCRTGGVFPVGRLDKDTTGLLLLTNDGVWAHRILSPKKHCHKVYEATVSGNIPEDLTVRFASRIVLADGTVCLPARALRIDGQTVEITVYEGRYHQVKRMCAAVGLQVLSLHRHKIGALGLDPALSPGQWRKLTEVERELPFVNK